MTKEEELAKIVRDIASMDPTIGREISAALDSGRANAALDEITQKVLDGTPTSMDLEKWTTQ